MTQEDRIEAMLLQQGRMLRALIEAKILELAGGSVAGKMDKVIDQLKRSLER